MYEFLVNGSTVATETYAYVGAEPRGIHFGDLTGFPGYNGHADISYIKIQNPPTCHTSVPSFRQSTGSPGYWGGTGVRISSR